MTVSSLVQRAQLGKLSGPGWYRVHRRLSIRLSVPLARRGVRPDAITGVCMATWLAGAALVAMAPLAANLAGFALLYAAFILDKVDGEVARLRGVADVRGVLLDRFHHRIVEPTLFLAAGWHQFARSGGAQDLAAGFAVALLANVIEEHQQLAPYILFKRLNEDGMPRLRRPAAPPAWRRARTIVRPLKLFRMPLTAMGLLLACVVGERLGGRELVGPFLGLAALALAVHLAFQCFDYYTFRLDEELLGVAEAHRRASATHVAGLLPLVLLLAAAMPQVAGAAVHYVDGANPGCSDTGDGSAASPYCTISAALARHHTAGTTIQVRPGVYREQVTVPASGLPGSPIELRANGAPGAPVVIDGSDDFSSGSKWRRVKGRVYVAASVTWDPVQVHLDGSRIFRSTGPPRSLPDRTYQFVAGEGLYLNPGAGDPGTHEILVGRRAYGIYLSGRSWVVLDGFTVRYAEDRGIQLTNAAHDVEVTNNTITRSGRFGLQLKGCSAIHVAGNAIADNGDHGISMVAGTTGCLIERNECFRNAYPSARSANGIYLFGAPKNRIRENNLHDNQDTGLQIQSFSDSNVFIQNVSWRNGDHGYDHLRAAGNLHIGDVAWGNYKDGFSIEGNAVGQTLANCIAVENGLTTNEFNLWVDDSSSAAFASDDNVFWNSTGQPPVKYRSTLYASVAAYAAASGQDGRTLQFDPRFVDPASGEFQLRFDSPAIDNANTSSPDWPPLDANGRPRWDDPGVPNRGIGPVAYADRGAFEFVSPAAATALAFGRRADTGSGIGVAKATAARAAGSMGAASGEGPDGSPASGLRPAVEPNPVHGSARLRFALSSSGAVTARLYSVDGRKVRTLLANEHFEAGSHVVAMEPRDDGGAPLPDGVYFCDLVAPEGRRAIRIVVVR